MQTKQAQQRQSASLNSALW